MVAPRTRAERPADIVPAARPARKGSRRAAAEGSDGSPPKRIRTKSNGAGLNGAASSTATKPAVTKPAPTKQRASGGAAVASPRKRTGIEALGDQLVAAIRKHDDDADVATIRRAIDFAVEAHGDQRRASGEPYVTHPIASAQILADLGIDPVAVDAPLLH